MEVRLSSLTQQPEGLTMLRGVGIVLLLAAPLAAQPPLRTRTFEVGALSAPLAPGQPSPLAEAMNEITARIQPETWQVRGGPGHMHYFPLSNTLAVHQTEAVLMLVDIHLQAVGQAHRR